MKITEPKKMVDVEKDKTKGEEVHEEIQRIRYVPAHALFAAVLLIFFLAEFRSLFSFSYPHSL